MGLSSLLVLLQATLSLLIAVQSNTALPPSVASSALQLAQQAITEASTALSSASSASFQPGIVASSVSTEVNIPQPATSNVESSSSASTQLSWLHFCPIIVPQQCSGALTSNYDPYGCVVSYTCSLASSQNIGQRTGNTTTQTTPTVSASPVPNSPGSSCVVHTSYCGSITVPNGSYAEDTRMCGIECVMQQCQNGTMVSASASPSSQIVNLSCANEPGSE